ncbi:MAG: metal-dependent hydrolase [Planctomycetales bacterium]|nr:metal-dependent hydrolase [Planctomycetales bacterium]
MRLTWLGHGGWQIEAAGKTLLLDPFLTACPTARAKPADLECDYLLLSHGHFDHVADAAEIAGRTGATLCGSYEITEWFRANHHVEHTQPMNLGGGISLDCGRLVFTTALHSSQLPDGSYGGNPGGFVLESEGKRIYFACDTALFSDMALIGKPGLDFAAVPIGDRFTMGPDDALEAVRLLKPKLAAPAHYNTWPPIAQDGAAWAERVTAETESRGLAPEVGEPFEV